jgi:hypothetical protein
VGVNKKAYIKNDILIRKKLKQVQINKPKDFKRKLEQHKLRSGVNLQKSIKQELGLH